MVTVVEHHHIARIRSHWFGCFILHGEIASRRHPLATVLSGPTRTLNMLPWQAISSVFLDPLRVNCPSTGTPMIMLAGAPMASSVLEHFQTDPQHSAHVAISTEERFFALTVNRPTWAPTSTLMATVFEQPQHTDSQTCLYGNQEDLN